MTNIHISTDKNKLDIPFIHNFITNSYWAKGRSMDAMQTCIDNSLNFGIYLDGNQVGYARLVTDFAQFAYIMDVFVDENFRGKGYSKMLMQYIMEHQDLQKIRVWRLATNDAHGLYEQFGFKPLAHPEILMEKFC